MSISAITNQFDAGKHGRESSAELDEVRRAALGRFSELGFPGRQIETWRYTDLSSLAGKDFRYNAPVPDAETLALAGALLVEFGLASGSSRCVFVDGHWVESLSSVDQNDGFEITTGAPVSGEPAPATALEALNTAFAPASACIRIVESAANPLELVFIGTGRNLAPQIRTAIELSAGVKATVIERFVDLDGADEAWSNQINRIVQSERSELTLYRLQSRAANQYQTTLNRVSLAEAAKFTSGNAEVGGALVRNEFEVALNGRDASAEIFGVTLTAGQQHSDMRIAIDHRAADTMSRQDFRAIVDDESRSVFNGKVTVQEQAQHIDAQQRNDNLLLSPKAEVDTKPELEIYADQVICSHGATVGELSEDHLFYLRARGIDDETARAILTAAFANSIIEKFELEDFRNTVHEAVDARLPRRIESN